MSQFKKTNFMIKKLTKNTPRFDFEWLDPRHQRMKQTLTKLSKRDYRIRTVESLCNVLHGKTAAQYVSDGIPIIKLRNVTNEGIRWDADYVLKSFFDENQKARLKLNDILVTATGEGTIGRVALFNKKIKCMAALDLNILRIKNRKDILPLYLVFYLRSPLGQMQLERYTVGSTGQTHLKSVENIEVAYPIYIRKQARIIRTCRRGMRSAVKSKNKFHSNIKKANIEFLKSPLAKKRFFLKKLSNNMVRFDFEYLNPVHNRILSFINAFSKKRGYKVSYVGNLCDVFRGKTARRYVDAGAPILKVRNLTGRGIDWDTDYVLKSFYEKNSSVAPKQGDILITSTGEGTIGRVEFFNKNIKCMVDGHITILRVKDEQEILPKYISYFMKSYLGQMQFKRYTVGSTGQTELNRDYIKKILIIYPRKIEKQQALVDKANHYEEIALQAYEEYKQNIEKVKSDFVSAMA